MQYMRVQLHPSGAPSVTHSHPYGRKTVRLPTLPACIDHQWGSQETHKNAHQRKTLRLRSLSLSIGTNRTSQNPSEDPRRRTPSRMRLVPFPVRRPVEPQESSSNTHGRKTLRMLSLSFCRLQKSYLERTRKKTSLLERHFVVEARSKSLETDDRRESDGRRKRRRRSDAIRVRFVRLFERCA